MKPRQIILHVGVSILTTCLAACSSGPGGNTPQPIAVAFVAQPPESIALGKTASFSAEVSNDTNGAGVSWTVTCGSTNCGGFNPTSTASGAATTFTAPAAIPTGKTVIVKATSVTDNTKSVSTTITITAIPQPPSALLNDGTYVFHMSGEDVNNDGSPYYIAGAFTVKNGVITGGEQDFVDMTTGTSDNLVAARCSLYTSGDGNIAIVLATNDPSVGVDGLETIHGSKVSNTRLLISEFDSFASASGSLDLQTGTAMPSGGYAFNLSGLDGGNPINALVIGGILNIAGNAVSPAGSILDYNDGGSVGQGQSFAAGEVTAPDAFGRITISLTPSSASGVPQFGMSGYIVAADRIELIEDLPDTLNGVLGGTALGQGSNTGRFTAATVSGKSYVYTAVGADSNSIATVAGGFSLNSNGTVSGNIAVNDLTVVGGPSIRSGNWVIGADGRVTITDVTPSLSTPFAFQLYLDGNGNALEIGVDATQATAGIGYLQTSGAINPGSYAMGALGFSSVNDNQPFWSAAGPVNIDDSGDWAGFTDYNVTGVAQTTNVDLGATTNSIDGVIMITGLDMTNLGADAWGYFPVDGSRAIAIEVDKNQLGALLIESVTP
jgi:hypothetical protein